jgi:hypothetical protein
MFARARSAWPLLLLPLTGCGSPSATGPTASSPAPATAPLTVLVDRNCQGQESQIRVYVDLQPIGLTNPGEMGVSQMVTVGQHQLSAISQRGTQWGPFPTTVSADGQIERLGCIPLEGPPDAL